MDQGKLDHFLVTGAGGMIGSALNFGLKMSETDLDVTDHARVISVCRQVKPAGIIHLAGLDIRQCQADPRAAAETNVIGTYYMAEQARLLNIPMVFLSSGAVFTGPLGAVFTEDAQPNPAHVYGRTKYVAEMLLERMLSKALIIRTGWVFGGHGAHHKKFVDQAIIKARHGEVIVASNDQTGSLTLVSDLLAEIRRLMLREASGIVHVVNNEPARGVDIARIVVDVMHSSSPIQIERARGIKDAGPERSASEVLVSKTVHLRSWREALREYVLEQCRVPKQL